MKRTIWIFGAALVAASIMIAQGPSGGQGKGDLKALPTKGAPRDPAASPASRPRPQSAAQTYTADEIRKGEQRFTAQCGFCHGRDAAGGETGPDLTRSTVVAEDVRGDKIRPLIKAGRVDQGMPAFTFSDADAMAIVAFVHTQKTKFDAESGGRRAVDPEDLTSGNADAGKRYFTGACAKCHSATGDLAGIGKRYEGLALLQRMLYPTAGRPAPKRPEVTLTLGDGQRVVAPLAGEDEWTISITDAAGARKMYEKSAVKFTVNDPVQAHFEQLGKYSDKDMHDVFAYLDSLK